MRTPAPLNAALLGTTAVTDQQWRQWFASFTNYYDYVLRWTDPYNQFFGKVEPPAKYKREGLPVYANGTDWNPGSGKGYYYWNGAAWVFIG